MTGKPLSGVSAPTLLVRTEGIDRSLPAGRSYVIGRDPECDIVIADARVSGRHAVLRLEDGHWVLVDNGSTNGTYAGGRRVDRIEINGECEVRFGHPGDGPVLSCTVSGGLNAPGPSLIQVPTSPVGAAGRVAPSGRATLHPEPIPPVSEPSVVQPPPTRTLRIGRAPDNDIVLSEPKVSRHHAELHQAS